MPRGADGQSGPWVSAPESWRKGAGVLIPKSDSWASLHLWQDPTEDSSSWQSGSLLGWRTAHRVGAFPCPSLAPPSLAAMIAPLAKGSGAGSPEQPSPGPPRVLLRPKPRGLASLLPGLLFPVPGSGSGVGRALDHSHRAREAGRGID